MPKARQAPLTTEVPLWDISPEGVAFTHDGRMEFAFRLFVPGSFFTGEDELAALAERLVATMLRAEAPVGERTRLYLEVSQSPATIPERYVQAVHAAPADSIHRRVAEARLKHYQEALSRGELRSWQIHLLQTLTPPRGLVAGSQYTQKEYRAAVEYALSVRNTFEHNLRAQGLQPHPLDFEGFFRFVFNYLNPDLAFSEPEPQAGTLREQLVRSPIYNYYNDKIRVGKTWIGGVTYPTIPPELSIGAAMSFLPESGAATVVVDLVHLPPGRLTAQLDLEYERVTTLNQDVKSPANTAKIREIDQAIQRMASRGEHVFDTNMLVVVQANTKGELTEKLRDVRAKIAVASGGRAQEKFGNFLRWWLHSVPGSARSLPQRFKMLDGDAAFLLPIQSPWPGSSHPLFLVETPQKTVAGLNPFDPASNRWNALYIGGSGSGKSFTVQQLLAAAMLAEPFITIVEKGDGYKSFVEAFGGNVIALTPGEDSGASINPFALPPGQTEPDAGKRARLVRIIRAMLSEGARNPAMERVVIESAIAHVYKNATTEIFDPDTDEIRKTFRTPRLSDFVAALDKIQATPDGKVLRPEQLSLAKEIQLELTGWIGDTPFAPIVDRDTNIDLANSINYFDVGALSSYPELLRVGVLLIADAVWENVLTQPGRQKLVVFDEVWDLLRNESARSFIEELFRTLRKHGGGAWAVTQSLGEIFEHLRGIISSVSFFYLFKLTNEERLAQELLDYGDHVVEAHKRLTTVPGQYAEFLYVQQTDQGLTGAVVRARPTPLEYWLFTTNNHDRAVRARYIEKHGGDVIKAVEALIRDGVTPLRPQEGALAIHQEEGHVHA